MNNEESIIIELSDFTSEQILYKVKRLVEEAEYERFTIFLKKKPQVNKIPKKKTLHKAKSYQLG